MILLISERFIRKKGYKNVPDGFRGLKWASSCADYKDLVLLQKDAANPSLEIFRREKEPMLFDDAVLKAVYYLFYDEKLCAVMIRYQGAKNFFLLNQALEIKHGWPTTPPHNSRYRKNEFCWLNDNVDICLRMNLLDNGSLSYVYKPIWDPTGIDIAKFENIEF